MPCCTSTTVHPPKLSYDHGVGAHISAATLSCLPCPRGPVQGCRKRLTSQASATRCQSAFRLCLFGRVNGTALSPCPGLTFSILSLSAPKLHAPILVLEKGKKKGGEQNERPDKTKKRKKKTHTHTHKNTALAQATCRVRLPFAPYLRGCSCLVHSPFSPSRGLVTFQPALIWTAGNGSGFDTPAAQPQPAPGSPNGVDDQHPPGAASTSLHPLPAGERATPLRAYHNPPIVSQCQHNLASIESNRLLLPTCYLRRLHH